MKQLRDIASDLVQRRLWPVALALVVALVAVPVVLGRGGDAAPVAPAPGADASGSPATGEKAEVTLDTTAPAERPAAEKVRDPFKAPAVKAAKTATDDASSSSSSSSAAPATTTSGASTSSTGSSSTGSSSTGSSSTGSSSTGTTKPKTTTKKPKSTTTSKADDAKDTYHVSLRITVDGGTTKTVRDIARLSPLPSVTDPFFVYLGVLETTGENPEKRAVFVVSSDATPNGEGACHPTKDDCETVELTVGQTAFFDYTAPDGKVTQYELELAGIHKTEVKAEAKAAAAIARHSVAGAELLRDAATRNVRAAGGARAYRYLPAVGLLVRAKRAKVTAKAAAAGEIPGLELVDRKHQPGLPVWHSPKK